MVDLLRSVLSFRLEKSQGFIVFLFDLLHLALVLANGHIQRVFFILEPAQLVLVEFNYFFHLLFVIGFHEIYLLLDLI